MKGNPEEIEISELLWAIRNNKGKELIFPLFDGVTFNTLNGSNVTYDKQTYTIKRAIFEFGFDNLKFKLEEILLGLI
jgi:hypothetical protein